MLVRSKLYVTLGLNVLQITTALLQGYTLLQVTTKSSSELVLVRGQPVLRRWTVLQVVFAMFMGLSAMQVVLALQVVQAGRGREQATLLRQP